jgi:hypothetical protein
MRKAPPSITPNSHDPEKPRLSTHWKATLAFRKPI